MGARMTARLAAAGLALFLGCARVSGQSRPPASGAQQATQRRGITQAATHSRLYGDSWYDFFLRQFNPDHLDRGAWIEQRRQIFLDGTARSPYFKYSLAVTVL